jgi:hypothetical protein
LAQFTQKGSTKELSDYLDANWKINSTMFDVDFQSTSLWKTDRYVHLEFNPLEIAEGFMSCFGPPNPREIFLKNFGSHFDIVAIAMALLSQQLRIECIAGDMSDVMERLEHRVLPHRLSPPMDPEGEDPRLFPWTYDRIHLSNVPYAVISAFGPYISADQ